MWTYHLILVQSQLVLTAVSTQTTSSVMCIMKCRRSLEDSTQPCPSHRPIFNWTGNVFKLKTIPVLTVQAHLWTLQSLSLQGCSISDCLAPILLSVIFNCPDAQHCQHQAHSQLTPIYEISEKTQQPNFEGNPILSSSSKTILPWQGLSVVLAWTHQKHVKKQENNTLWLYESAT